MPLQDVLPFLIPITALMIPIVAILTAHQRKMAEVLHSNQTNQYNPEIAALRQEMIELKQLIHQQAIALDNLSAIQAKASPPQTIQERINLGAG